MFSITINQYSARSVTITGCPTTGIAAVDWRRERGIEAAPHNRVDVKLKWDHEGNVSAREALIRELGGGDANANLWFTTQDWFALSPEAAAAWYRGKFEPAVRELYQQDLEHERREQEKREQESADCDRRARELSEEIVAHGAESLLHRDRDGEWDWKTAWELANGRNVQSGHLSPEAHAVIDKARDIARSRNQQEEAERAAVIEQRRDAIREWAMQSDAFREQAEEKLLDLSEAETAWRDEVFASIDLPRYQRIKLSDVCTCEYPEETDCRLECNVDEAEHLTHAEYVEFKRLRQFVLDALTHRKDGVQVVPRVHRCTTDECSHELIRLSVLVTVQVTPLISFSREYALSPDKS